MGWGQSNIADLTEGTMAACHSEKKRRGAGWETATQRSQSLKALPTALKGLTQMCMPLVFLGTMFCFIFTKGHAIEIKLGIQAYPNEEHTKALKYEPQHSFSSKKH